MTPALLKNGDKIGLVAPSRVIDKGQMQRAYQIFEQWGLQVAEGKALYNKNGYFAGTDDERLADLQGFLDDEAVKAIFCARGGYGMTRIVDRLDFTLFGQNPKWVVGFSDITALHLAIHKRGTESVHGLMPVQYGYENVEDSLKSLHNLLFDRPGKIEAKSHENNRYGHALAPLIGGNLSLMAESLGTPTEVDTENKILFLEEVDEYLYKVDRMFVQLQRAKKLECLAGLVIGDFSEMKDTQIKFGANIFELIMAHVKHYNFPVAFGLPIGHEPVNMAVPVSREASFTVGDGGATLSFN